MGRSSCCLTIAVSLPFFILMMTSENSFSQQDQDLDELIYNERVDERPPEARKSQVERQEELLEKLEEIKRTEAKPAEGKPEPESAPAQPPPSEADRPSSPATTVITGGAEGKEADDAAAPDVEVENELVFTVRLNNPNRVPFNSLGFAIKFDPKVLEVLDQSEELLGVNIRDASAADLGLQVGPDAQGYINEVNRTEGIIHFRASLPSTQAYTNQSGVIGRFVVRALKPRGNTSLDFHNVLSGDSIDATLKQEPEKPVTFLRMLKEDSRDQVMKDTVLDYGANIRVLSQNINMSEQDHVEFYPTYLKLVPEKKQIRVGEEFDVYVELENPEGQIFDAVELYVKFDQRALKVLDTDEDNYITRGVNISVGEYRDNFPMNGVNKNEADQESGEIRLSMKSFSEALSASGRIARIRFEG